MYTTQPLPDHKALLICVSFVCKCQKTAALRIESFPRKHSINVVLTRFKRTRQGNSVRVKAKIMKFQKISYLSTIKAGKTWKRIICQKSFLLSNIRLVQLCYGCMKTILFQNIHFLHLHCRANTFHNNKQCHMRWRGLGGCVC